MFNRSLHVRFESLADIAVALPNVRFTPKSDISETVNRSTKCQKADIGTELFVSGHRRLSA